MILVVNPAGQVHCIYDECIDLATLGTPIIHRASHVEPDEHGRWWADLAPVGGPVLGPCARRSEAIDAERDWLESHWFMTAEKGDHVENSNHDAGREAAKRACSPASSVISRMAER